MKLNLHIERIVLDGTGVSPEQIPSLQASVQNELIRLLGSGGLAPELCDRGEIAKLTTGNIREVGNDAKDFGRQIARSVHGGIGNA